MFLEGGVHSCKYFENKVADRAQVGIKVPNSIAGALSPTLSAFSSANGRPCSVRRIEPEETAGILRDLDDESSLGL